MRTTIQRSIAPPTWALMLVCVLAAGCSDASSTGEGADAGVSTDQATDDVGLEGAHDGLEPVADGEADSEEVTDALSGSPSDLSVITEISEDVDLSEYFPDSVGPDADGPTDTGSSEPDGESLTDTVGQEADGVLGDAIGDAAALDVFDESETFLADCENLGVAPQWTGAFEGAIEYHIPEALEELFYPPDGILIVAGSLSFDIECVDSKLIVSGDMAGTANVSGEGDFPFTITLAGYFNPETGLLNANLVDGMVVLYGLAEIYFSGDFVGTLTDDLFNGTWTGLYNGTNFPLPPGDVPDADGLGTWSAQAAEVE
jgi:hypothetical protein